ncbi:hypothetical protein MXD62_19850 [Frankia sp. Mgl5]|uniref:hypothetical protein n=1 Tax=Frankia sp. Mgl5 TaxID=2933793 RepID=UPI00200DB69F|nr:hypothetical protein [Frankia sp. Mgl5]MCK9929405.1 hypothetical protein [Frankia sp. Mgl5]
MKFRLRRQPQAPSAPAMPTVTRRHSQPCEHPRCPLTITGQTHADLTENAERHRWLVHTGAVSAGGESR